MTFAGLSNADIDNELRRIEDEWDALIRQKRHDEGQAMFGDRFHALLKERDARKMQSAPHVIRLRFLVGESSRDLDRACAEALGWRVSHDEWWNWHPGPVYDPPGDAWCIRKDGRNDLPCNEALPHFTAEIFRAASFGPPPNRRERARDVE